MFLTPYRIQQIAGKPKVKGTEVHSFFQKLKEVNVSDKKSALECVELAAKTFAWNKQTTAAVKLCINDNF